MRHEDSSFSAPDTPASVLVVSDNRETAALVAEFLRRENYAVGCIGDVFDADSALETLDGYLDETFDVILLDVALAGTDGLEVLQRAQARGVSIPIIVLTASADDAHALETMRAGAFDYVAEPLDFVYLGETLAAAVAHQVRRNRAGSWSRPLPGGP